MALGDILQTANGSGTATLTSVRRGSTIWVFNTLDSGGAWDAVCGTERLERIGPDIQNGSIAAFGAIGIIRKCALPAGTSVTVTSAQYVALVELAGPLQVAGIMRPVSASANNIQLSGMSSMDRPLSGPDSLATIGIAGIVLASGTVTAESLIDQGWRQILSFTQGVPHSIIAYSRHSLDANLGVRVTLSGALQHLAIGVCLRPSSVLPLAARAMGRLPFAMLQS